MHPEFVGILLNNSTYRRISSGRIGTESLSNYEEAAAIYGLVPCFLPSAIFRLKPERSPDLCRSGRTDIHACVFRFHGRFICGPFIPIGGNDPRSKILSSTDSSYTTAAPGTARMLYIVCWSRTQRSHLPCRIR